MQAATKHYLCFAVAVAVNIAATVWWYATLPHQTSSPGHIVRAVIFLTSVVVGIMDIRTTFARMVFLGLLLAVISGPIRWIASASGKAIDHGTPFGAFMLMIISSPIVIGLTVFGGLIGLGIRKIMTS
jgi:hypothetical protein